MNTQIQVHNKTLISHRKSRRSIQSFKTLGISKRKYYSAEDRKKERYKRVGNKMRERYRKSRGLSLDGRRRRRRR
jgi:hypothetical protein